MTISRLMRQGESLSGQLEWFIRLRWIAGAAVIAGSAADRQWLGWYENTTGIFAVGLIILGYNALLWMAMRRTGQGNELGRGPHRRYIAGGSPRRWLLGLAWAQLLLDLACLTLLVLWTGGIYSPLAGFFVFHMVFASLLLPRRMAYGGFAAAAMMLAAGLGMTGQWPADHVPGLGPPAGVLILLGLGFTLLLTVFLSNHLTVGLRRQRRRLLLQNRRIRSMAGKLRQQQQAMVQSEKMVAMGHMAAGITHEIANPLASIDSLLQLMQRKPERLNDRSITTLREQVTRIDGIIRQMKAFAHPQIACAFASGEQAASAKPQASAVPLNEVVERALQMLRFDRRLARVQIERQLDPDAGTLPLLPQALEQILLNIIQNAVDAMADTPDPRLVIRTEWRKGDCLLEVTDNGHGIRPEHMDRLFEPFFTTKPVGEGTGLGLSISYSLVQKQGGNISVRSNPGLGTTFAVCLPAASALAAGSAIPCQSRHGTQ